MAFISLASRISAKSIALIDNRGTICQSVSTLLAAYHHVPRHENENDTLLSCVFTDCSHCSRIQPASTFLIMLIESLRKQVWVKLQPLQPDHCFSRGHNLYVAFDHIKSVTFQV